MIISRYSFLSFLIFSYYFFTFSLNILNAQEKDLFKEKVLELTENEDKELIEDVLLNYNDLVHKYTKDMKYDLDEIYTIYVDVVDPFQKIAILNYLRTQDMKDSRVVNLLYYGLITGFYSHEEKNIYKNIATYWKVRSFAIRLLMEKVADFDKAGVLKLILGLTTIINYDKENRSKSLALIGLAKLIKDSKSAFTDKEYDIYYSNVENIYFRFLDEIDYNFANLDLRKYYLHWALVRSIGILKTKRGAFKLLKLFNKFNFKIKYEVIRSIKQIQAANSGSPSK